jgi:3-hydroxyisobutyrate dehydrogenase
MNKIKIGWIGLGNMGIPMASRLLTAGYPVAVFNRTREKEHFITAAGATSAANPAVMLVNCDVVFLMVSDDQATRDIFNGNDGLQGGGMSGKLIINMSTVSPAISREFAGLCKKQGNEYLDAPVSGSVKQAKEGQLVIMVGAPKPAFERATPILEHLGRLVLRLGDHGAGSTAKLAINLLLGIHAQGLAEAALFAKRHGIGTEAFLTIFNNSALGNAFGKAKGEAIVAGNYEPAFALKHIAKDLRLARTEGWDTPLAETTFDSFQDAETRFGNQDIIAIFEQLAQPPSARLQRPGY